MDKKQTERLINSIKSGGLEEEKAIEQVYDECWESVKKLKNKNLPFDELNGYFIDAIIIVRQSIKNGKSNIADFCAYLYTTTKRLWLKEIKKTGNHNELDGELISPVDSSIEDIIDEQILDERTKRLLEEIAKAIGVKCLDIIFKKESKWSMKELAEYYNFSNADSAKTAHKKCRDKLKKFMDNNPGFKNFFNS